MQAYSQSASEALQEHAQALRAEALARVTALRARFPGTCGVWTGLKCVMTYMTYPNPPGGRGADHRTIDLSGGLYATPPPGFLPSSRFDVGALTLSPRHPAPVRYPGPPEGGGGIAAGLGLLHRDRLPRAPPGGGP